MAQSIFYAPDNSLKAQSLSLYSGQVFLPVWADADAWRLKSGALTRTGISGVALDTTDGFVAAASDGASGVWLAQYYDQLMHLTTAGVTSPYTMPTSAVMTGGAYNPGQTAFYSVDSSGYLWVAPSLGTHVTSGAAFGLAPAKFLATSGATLYTLLPAASGLGIFTLSTSAAGTSAITLPGFVDLVCLAVSGANVAVGGTTRVAYGSGYTALAMDPASGTYLLGVQQSAGMLAVYTNQGGNIYAETQTISGLGNPQDIAWSPSDVFAFAADSTAGSLLIFTNTLGTLSQTQTLSLANATATGISPDSLRGLVSQTASNQLTAIGFNGSTWATSGTVALAQPGPVAFSDALDAWVGFASGVANLQSIANVWSLASSAALPFAPTDLATDPFSSTLYACGTKSGSGYVATVVGTTMTASAAWTGRADALLYTQGQIAVLDKGAAQFRTYGVVAGSLISEDVATAPTSAATLTQSLSGIFAAGTTDTWQYQYHAPYSLRRTQVGQVGIYNGSTWVSASLGPTGVPVAVAFDSNGNVTVATLQNGLYTVASSGTLVSGSAIPQFAGQPQTVPLGVSSLLYSGASLYASTVLNDALIQVR